MASRRQVLTEAQREQRRIEQRELVVASIEQLRCSDGWGAYLTARARFRSYSARNVLMILQQHPAVTRVAGFRAWLDLGWCVTKGSTAIRIWAKRAILHRMRPCVIAASVLLGASERGRNSTTTAIRSLFAGLMTASAWRFASHASWSHQMRSEITTAAADGEPPGALEAAMDRLFGEGVRPLRLEEALFAAMLDGWERRQRARMLRPPTIIAGVRLVRRVQVRTERWPWEWTAIDLEDFISDLASAPHYRRPATLRNYQSQLRGFLDYLVDERYPWRLVCTSCFGNTPVQLLDEYNTIVHVGEHESDPGRRALTRDELQALFDQCDRRVAGRRALRRKVSLAALRDGAMFKVCYGWGLRRTELIGLDVCDLLINLQQPRFGRCGIVRVRHGKGSRGSAPKRRDVLTAWSWAAGVLEQYVSEIRPLFGFDEHPALWLTERGGRISARHVDERFAELRDELGMDRMHTPHALRHSYVTHLHEEGFDALFVKEQVGHRYMSTTALYTGVSSDYKQRALAAALDAQLTAMAGL